MPKKEKGDDEIDNNIKIFLRIRPTKKASGFFECNSNTGRVNFELPKEVAVGLVNNTRTMYDFNFDKIIGMESTQEEVFEDVAQPVVASALEGFNATIFAYGQTGSGKTFTITGGAEKYIDRGIIPRTLSWLFNEFKQRSDAQFNMHISYLEIYNETGYDLLDPNHETKALEDLPKVTMMEDEDGNCHLRNLSMHLATSEEEALNLLFLGDTNRAISETPMNLASSRSHCIFTISIEGRAAGSDVIRRSKLHLVDLAGSERVAKTGAKGALLREAKYINTSLHFLEMCIVALHERNTKGRGHIPYRNSMMTSVLRDSLGGNCRTSMVATISAEGPQTDESISTSRFAQRVAQVKNSANVNEELDPTLVIKRLKAEIAELNQEITVLKGDMGEGVDITDEAKDDLRAKVKVYVGDRDPDSTLQIGDYTYAKIRTCFELMKEECVEARKNGGGGGGGDGGGGGGGGGPGDDKLHANVAYLTEQIQQRDTEIAILVNMVKQGKTVAPGIDLGALGSRSAAGPPGYGRPQEVQAPPKPKGPIIPRPSEEALQVLYTVHYTLHPMHCTKGLCRTRLLRSSISSSTTRSWKPSVRTRSCSSRSTWRRRGWARRCVMAG
jgi:kinesin family protein 6/9